MYCKNKYVCLVDNILSCPDYFQLNEKQRKYLLIFITCKICIPFLTEVRFPKASSFKICGLLKIVDSWILDILVFQKSAFKHTENVYYCSFDVFICRKKFFKYNFYKLMFISWMYVNI